MTQEPKNKCSENRIKAKAYRDRTRAQRNQKRREQYANDPQFREKCKRQVSVYRKANPEKRRAANLKSLYGVEHEDYLRLLDKQDNACAICRIGFSSTPHMDHNHETGKPRGLLCSKCNFGIGSLDDSADRLRRAAEYLEQDKHE